jgi:hypothetical protein
MDAGRSVLRKTATSEFGRHVRPDLLLAGRFRSIGWLPLSRSK